MTAGTRHIAEQQRMLLGKIGDGRKESERLRRENQLIRDAEVARTVSRIEFNNCRQ